MLKVAMETVDFNDRGIGLISGRAPPDTVLKIYIDNKLSKEGNAGSSGSWKILPSRPLPYAKTLVRIDALDQTGKVFSRAEVKIARPDKPIYLHEDSLLNVQRGNSLWRLERRVYGEGFFYTLIYEANHKQIREPDLIYPGQVFYIPPVKKHN